MAQSQSPASKSNPTNGNSAEPGLAELQNQIEILKNDIQGLSRTLGEVGRAETYRLAEAAKAKGAAVKSASEEQLEHLRRRLWSRRLDVCARTARNGSWLCRRIRIPDRISDEQSQVTSCSKTYFQESARKPALWPAEAHLPSAALSFPQSELHF